MLYNFSMNGIDFQKQIEEKGVICFVPNGNSMWPTIKNKHQSIIVKKKENRLKEYEVGFFVRKDGTPVLHRVVKVLEDGYIFRGDSQFYTEDIEEEKVFGVMVGLYKGKKYIDVDDQKYQIKLRKYLDNERKRKFYCNFYYHKLSLKSKIKKLFSGKRKNV